MDKGWMKLRDKLSPEYRKGVSDFLAFACKDVSVEERLPYPCVKCNNVIRKTQKEIEADLVIHGIVKNYIRWHLHGENWGNESESKEAGQEEVVLNDGMTEMLEEALHVSNMDYWEDDDSNADGHRDEPTGEAAKFFKLLEDAKQVLYPGSQNSKLLFIVKLLHLKCLNGWTDKSITLLLEFFKEMFPRVKTIPKTYYEAKRVIRDLGLDYVKIDACPNDCMLYRKEHIDANQCLVCGVSRWTSTENIPNETSSSTEKVKKTPLKTLWYFPVKPRLQRFYMSSKTAKDMTWHHRECLNDGALRHPADSEAWKVFDRRHPLFASDALNVRLGLATDGFNPYGKMSSSYSTWPVIMVLYNLPPWMCLKQPYSLLSLLIPGPKAPGNDIDVYLQHLIEELKELWDVGVETYDACARQNFTMRTAIMWTINDFPAYANLSGWSTRGALACPSYNINTDSYWLPNGKKHCYMGHRRWLPENHLWRSKTVTFNNYQEFDTAPKLLSGEELLEQLDNLEQVTFGKTGTKRKRKEGEPS